MQVNPVHALLNLIRAEAAQGRSGQLRKQQIEALAELLAEGNTSIAKLGQMDKARGPIAIPGLSEEEIRLQHGESQAHAKFGPHITSATSDAINLSKHQINGRSWNYTLDADQARMALRGDASAEIQPGSLPVMGVALPFNPSPEDIERALLTGNGWPKEWGEDLRQRLLHQKPHEPSETLVGISLRFAIAILLLAVAIVLFR